MADPYKDIYDLRQDCGRRRQPTYGQALDDLDAVIRPAPHPYDLKLPAIQQLMNNTWFRVGALGLQRPATLPASGYIYRICPIKKLTDYSHNWFSSSPRKDDQPPLIFHLWKKKVEELERKAGGKKVWLRLRSYARDRFYGPRSFSFWTGHELDPYDSAKLLVSAHALGLPNDWIDEYSVVMKCDTSFLQGRAEAKIPTTLDGFDSHIFHPRRESLVPPSGITIELSLTAPLHRGQDEFAIGPVETAAIQMYPVQIPSTLLPCIKSDDNRLLSSLHVYYQQL